jgi:hypothetical protein
MTSTGKLCHVHLPKFLAILSPDRSLRDKPMPVDPQFLVDLQALCDKYQIHVTGTATPVATESEPFDLTVTAAAPAAGGAAA